MGAVSNDKMQEEKSIIALIGIWEARFMISEMRFLELRIL